MTPQLLWPWGSECFLVRVSHLETAICGQSSLSWGPCRMFTASQPTPSMTVTARTIPDTANVGAGCLGRGRWWAVCQEFFLLPRHLGLLRRWVGDTETLPVQSAAGQCTLWCQRDSVGTRITRALPYSTAPALGQRQAQAETLLCWE